MKTYFITIFSIILSLILFTGCTSDNDFSLQEPTFPEDLEPFDISSIEAEPVQDGIEKYIVEEGYGEDRVVIRDDILVFITLRNLDGDFIYSSYQNERTSPDFITVMNIALRTSLSRQELYEVQRSLSEGLRKGIIGMKEGEKRVLIVPPEEGLANVPTGDLRASFRSDTLRYDLELNAIF